MMCNCKDKCGCGARNINSREIVNTEKLDNLNVKRNQTLDTILENIDTEFGLIKKGFNPRGEYDPGAVYNKMDLVVFEGNGYISLVNNNKSTPNSALWRKYVNKGDQGIQGIQGIQGVAGPEGPKGDPLMFDDLTPEQIEEMAREIGVNRQIDTTDLRPVDSTAVYQFTNQTVDNVSRLRATEGKEGQIITLLGYYEAGDKEPLSYKFTSNKGVDDGGSVINSSTGSWLAVFSSSINIVDFGCLENTYIDDILIKILAVENINTIKFPKTTTNQGFLIGKTIEVKGNILGNETVLTIDSKQFEAFRIIDDCVISGFISNCNHSTSPLFSNVPIFISKRVITNSVIIEKNTINNLRIHLNSGNGVNEPSYNTYIRYNNINCDFTNFPIYDIQNDILTSYNTINLYIYNNNIRGINTNRCFKVSSTSINGNDILSYNIKIHNNNIDLNGVYSESGEAYGSKQLLDLFQNSYQIYFYDNIIKSRNYSHIFENKSSDSFSIDRNTYIYGNEFDIDSVYVYREVGNYGNTTVINSTGKVNTYINDNSIHISSTTDAVKSVMQTIGVNNLNVKNNLIKSYNCVCICSFSNLENGNVSNNILENIIIRNTLTLNNNIGDDYVSREQNLNYTENNIVYSVNLPLGVTTTYGCFEFRTNSPKINSLNIFKNSFNKDINYTGNILPYFLTADVYIDRLNVNNNKAVNFQNPTINIVELNNSVINDFSNSWADINYKELTNRIIVQSNTLSISPRAGFIMYDAVGTSDFTVTLNKGKYNNKGSFFIFKNSMNVNNFTISAGLDVTFTNITLLPGESAIYMTYNNNQYRIIGNTFKQSANVSNIVTADATDLATSLILINELKTKLNAKLNADRNSGQQATI